MRRSRLVRWWFAVAVVLGWLAVRAPVLTAAATPPPTTAPAAADTDAVLAHATADCLWVAAVDSPKTAADKSTESSDRTQILVRLNLPNQSWHVLGIVPGRATSLATRDSQLAVLLSDGTWLTMWADGTATGQPLPAGGVLRTLADDGRVLWAIGTVRGGQAAADRDLARIASGTRPASMPATTVSTAGAATRPARVDELPRLVVFHQLDGRWAPVSELPPDVPVAAVDDLSFAVVNGVPTVAYKLPDGLVRTLRWSSEHGWDDVGWAGPDAGKPIVGFALLPGAAGPMLWTTTGADAGRVRLETGGTGEPAEAIAPRTLVWPGQHPLTGVPTAAVAGGYLRVVGRIGDHVFEQRYDPAGAAVGTPSIVFAADQGPSLVVQSMEVLLMSSLVFAVGTSVYRQMTPVGMAVGGGGGGRAAPVNDVDGVVPAPLGRRALAGAIDLLPVAGAGVAALITLSQHPDATLPTVTQWVLVAAGIVYLAHTAILEALTARSAGKWVMGLRVATVDGGRPAVWQLVARNLLRLVDPLVWIALSPLRQRTADVLAGTVVVPLVAVAPPDPKTEA